LLKKSYRLSYTKVLIRTKLKGKLDWFRSNSKRMKASNDDLFKVLCDMFNQSLTKSELRKIFENLIDVRHFKITEYDPWQLNSHRRERNN